MRYLRDCLPNWQYRNRIPAARSGAGVEARTRPPESGSADKTCQVGQRGPHRFDLSARSLTGRGRPGSGLQPAIVHAHSRACAVSNNAAAKHQASEEPGSRVGSALNVTGNDGYPQSA
jgi:hypothetical protein